MRWLDIFRREIEARRKEPRSDFITALVNAHDEGDTLTVDEMLGALILIIVAGHDTTSNSMTLGARALARNPAAWRRRCVSSRSAASMRRSS